MEIRSFLIIAEIFLLRIWCTFIRSLVRIKLAMFVNQANQGGQPPIFTTQESQPSTAESQGIQPPIATENTPTADLATLPPQPLKKRKPNASLLFILILSCCILQTLQF
ncbi:hypothetical protein P8452_01256 [Trifolium repens]|nr:hypothetical protein P8452_01256 [Trifolium repens]